MIEIVFESHSTSEDNEAGRATGWLPGRLSAAGRAQAAELGERRRDDGIAAVFCWRPGWEYRLTEPRWVGPSGD
jgi:broad specificity phosphatase PhoE